MRKRLAALIGAAVLGVPATSAAVTDRGPSGRHDAASNHRDTVASGRPGHPSAGPTRLRVDALSDPAAIDDTTPTLSWEVPAGAGTQRAYQVRAAGDARRLDHPDLWDTGRVRSSDSIGVEWGGTTLRSRTQVTWQVRVWGDDGRAGEWSRPARFGMGLLDAADWSADWIGNPEWLERKPTPATVDLPAQDTRYVRITTTEVGQALAESGSLVHRLQLAEIVIEDSAHPGTDLARGATVTASDPKTYPGKWEPAFVADGRLTSATAPFGYSSSAFPTPTPPKPITLTLDLGANRHLDRLLLYPRTDAVTADGRTPNFPVDFTVSTSADGSTWSGAADIHDQKEPPAYNLDLPPLPLFAKQFTIDKPLRSARLYATGLGIYDARINGAATTEAVLQPGNTDYHQRIGYSAEDVTRLLRHGANALSVRLGAGTAIVPEFPDRYTKWTGTVGPPELMAQLEITYADGSTQRIVSDDSWRTTLGPTVFSQWYGGEDYDARRDQPGWDRPGADLARWAAAATTTAPAATTKLTAQMAPPIEPVDELDTAAITQPKPGTYVFDLGTNIAGWPRLHLSGPAGTTVTVKPGERLGDDGLVDQSTMIKGGATYPPILDHYTLSGRDTETWHPQFVYHGFRYLQLTGLPGRATRSMVDAIVLRAANEKAGNFDSSSDLLDAIHSLIDRSVQGNMYSVLTDCPDREKLGWLEEDHLQFDTIARGYDVAAYYRDLVRNMAESQLPNGMVPAIAPLVYNVFGGNPDQQGEPNWGSAMVLAPWQMYRTYGDVDTLRTYYPAMKRYLGYLQGRSRDDLLDYGLGDWGAIDESTPTGISASYAYQRTAAALADIATVLHEEGDAAGYRAHAQRIADAYNAKYLDTTEHTYANGTQADDAFSLDLGIVPEGERAGVLRHLVASIRANDNHVSVGEIALPALFRVLSAAHRDDVVYDIATQTTSPSYGYQVITGATALAEYWDGTTGYGSQDHFMMGAIDQWFTSALGGIGQAPDSIGYRDLLVSPRVVGDLTHAGTTYRTPYGTAASRWRIDGRRFRLDVTVPGNSRATVQVPLWRGHGGASAPHGAHLVRRTETVAEYRVGPGTWRFAARTAEPVPADRIQVAVTPPAGSVPVLTGRETSTSFGVYNFMDRPVTVRPDVHVSDGFSATAPRTVSLPPHRTTDVAVRVRASDGAQHGTLRIAVGGHAASAAIEGTDDLARIAVMSASSTHSKWDPARTNDGQTTAQTDYAVWNSGQGWNDNTSREWPDALAATWSAPERIARVRVLTIDSPNQPAARYGLRDYDVQARMNDTWTTVASVRANTAGTVESRFPAVRTSALRLVITDTNDHSYSRVVELEAYSD